MIVAQTMGWGVLSLLVGLGLGGFLVANIWRERRALRIGRDQALEEAARQLPRVDPDESVEPDESHEEE